MPLFQSFLLIFLICLCGCHSAPKIISSYKHIPAEGEITPADEFTVNIDSAVLETEIPGKYSYLINPGISSIIFTIDGNSQYAAHYWQNASAQKNNRGSWRYKNDTFLLKKNGLFSQWYVLQPYRIGPLIFLVPKEKQKIFTNLVNNNREKIQHVRNNYDRLRTPDILQQLSFLRGHCLIKEKRL